MINCKYCGVYQETIKPNCPSCGAPMQVEEKKTSEKTEAQILAEKIARICDHHMSRDFKDGTSIPPKKMDAINKLFPVFPTGKKIFFYCDTTPFGTGKHGFMICEDGIYWHNSWTTATNHNFINWDTFKDREFAHKKFDLDLGKGDVIDVSGMGSNGVREILATLFRQIHAVLNEPPQNRS